MVGPTLYNLVVIFSQPKENVSTPKKLFDFFGLSKLEFGLHILKKVSTSPFQPYLHSWAYDLIVTQIRFNLELRDPVWPCSVIACFFWFFHIFCQNIVKLIDHFVWSIRLFSFSYCFVCACTLIHYARVYVW